MNPSPLLPSPSDGRTAKQKDPQIKAPWKCLFVFTRRSHAPTLLVALAATACIATLKTYLAVALGNIFNLIADFGDGQKSGPDALHNVVQWCIILVLMGIGNWLASSAFLALWITFGELQASNARRTLCDSLLKKEMSWFDSLDQGVPSLLVRIQTQTRELQLATSQVFGLLLGDALTSLASFAIALFYSWKLALVIFATLPISGIILALVNHRIKPAAQNQKHHLAVASKYATASITAIDLVKVFNGYDEDVDKYRAAIQKAGRHFLVQAACNSVQIGYVSFWVVAMFVVGFWYGVTLVNQGAQPGHILTAFYATLAAFQAIESLMPQWLVLIRGRLAGAFLSDLVSRGADKSPSPWTAEDDLVKPGHAVGAVEMLDVSFSYPSNPSVQVLNPTSFYFPAGETTFVVGRSGSGKSTLGNLLVNFYTPSTGCVHIDRWPLHLLQRDWLHSHVTLISQSSVVFDGTFFQNVALGHPEPDSVTRSQAIQACEFALLQSTVNNLPYGLDTPLGLGGQELSGGQRQRLALARAYLRDPLVLILDEATSELDQESRAWILDAIRTWRARKTTVIITHDVSQILNDDFVYVMHTANLVSKGFRKDLERDNDSYFAALARFDSPQPPSPFPIQIHIQSPQDCNTTLPTNAAPYPPTFTSRLSRVSQIFTEGMENNFLTFGTSRLSHHTSLGKSAALSIRKSSDQLSVGERFSFGDVPFMSNPNRSESSFNSHQLVPPYLLRHSASEEESDLTEMKPRTSTWETRSDLGKEEMPEPDFVFGGADRRKDITRLRQSQTLGNPIREENHKESKEKSGSLFTTLKSLGPLLDSREKMQLLGGLVCCVAVAAATPVFSYCFAQLLGVMWSSGDKAAEGRKWAIYILVIALLDGISTTVSRYLLERVAQSWVTTIRVRVLGKILRQGRSWFDDSKNSAGRLNECLDRNAEEMRNIVGRFVPLFLTAVLMILVSFLWAMTISWKLTLVFLSPLPAFLGAVQAYGAVSGKWEAGCNEAAEETSAVFTDALTNIQVVRALNLGKHFKRKYEAAVSRTVGVGLKRALYSCIPFGLYESINYAVTTLVFYYGTLLLTKREDGISATQVLQVVNLLLFGMGTAAGLFASVPQLTMAQVTAEKLLAYLDLPIPHQDSGGRQDLDSVFPVRMQNLQFAYEGPSNKQVLSRVSLDITPDYGCTAIVGRSGCGKSTLLSLLLGLYSPLEGASQTENALPPPLSFNNTSVHDMNFHHLRSHMAYIPQKPLLFPATIYENIIYGLPKASPFRQIQYVYQATSWVGIHDFIISLPEGYHTVVGDGGQALSGGQAQRLSLARALVRHPRLLILDEPTSSLDAESADVIRNTIRDLTRRKGDFTGEDLGRDEMMTVVMVTHSREMMEIADRVVMVEGGTVVEEGGYHELLLAGGPFSQLVRSGNLGETFI